MKCAIGENRLCGNVEKKSKENSEKQHYWEHSPYANIWGLN